MAVQKINIEQFLTMAEEYPVLDVRSPGEFFHAHIPAAFSLPLFTDEERKIVGTAYKQNSRETAIKIGLDFFGVKMRKMIEEAGKIMKHPKQANGLAQHENAAFEQEVKAGKGTVLVHCWRGGMRSAGVAWLLDLYGFKVYTLAGGYKAYRRWAREQFEKSYNLTIVGGYTGSGKTLVLHELQKAGQNVIDLEGMGNHKGSAFGAFGQDPQPSQEMFENILANTLYLLTHKGIDQLNITPSNDSYDLPVIFVEDESQRIGNLNIPTGFWNAMRKSPIGFLEIPFEERLEYLTEEYGKIKKEELVNAVIRIQKRLGGLETKNAIGYLLEDNHKECFRILLAYYDKWYNKGLVNRENLTVLLHKIPCKGIDVKLITQTLLNEKAFA